MLHGKANLLSASGVSNLQVKIDNKDRTYALLVADTVVVKEQGSPENLTAACNKAWSDVAYFFKVSALSHHGATTWPDHVAIR